MIEKHISFNFEGRYFSIGGNAKENILTEIWFVLHGQGQLANYFLEKFRPLAQDNRKIIAPEGLSRYYLQGFSGRVGASWMTRENRLKDINNYLNFLTSVYNKEVPKDIDIKITLLGFSQGAATASRWALTDSINIQHLILWAGIFPPDLDLPKGQEKFKNLKISNVYGDRDEYLNNDRLAEQAQVANKLGVSYSKIVFQGGHQIDEDALLRLI